MTSALVFTKKNYKCLNNKKMT